MKKCVQCRSSIEKMVPFIVCCGGTGKLSSLLKCLLSVSNVVHSIFNLINQWIMKCHSSVPNLSFISVYSGSVLKWEAVYHTKQRFVIAGGHSPQNSPIFGQKTRRASIINLLMAAAGFCLVLVGYLFIIFATPHPNWDRECSFF